MYYTGTCPDYRFVYDRQPPSLTELMQHLQTEGKAIDITQDSKVSKPKVIAHYRNQTSDGTIL